MEINFLSGISPSKGINKGEQKRVFLQKSDSVEFKNKKETKERKQSLFKRFKTAFVALFSSLTTALAVIAVSNKKTAALRADNEKIKADNETMKSDNQSLKEQNQDLQTKNSKLQAQLDGIVLPENIDNIVADKVLELNLSGLSYSPTTRIGKEDKDLLSKNNNKNPVIVMPNKYEKTTNRSDAKQLDYPEFEEGKSYSFSFPYMGEVRLKCEDIDFSPIPRTFTNISEAYADSLQWNNDKIARDLMQNFYDGHGQTLGGIKFNVTPTENGKYTVRIEGKSTFSPDKAILLGESSKRYNDKAAGNYGEGLKMVVLKLLREKGAENVDIASANWNVNWQLQDSGLGKKVLAYELDEVPQFDGNYIQFDTDNVDFIKAIINSFDKFYHYNNPAFKCPDFENDMVAVKLIDEKADGKFFINGQAFEVGGSYDGMKSMNIAIKKKPPLKYNGEFIFDPSRDRTSLTKDNLEALGSWVISKENMSKEDAVKLIHSLEEYWGIGTFYGRQHDSAGASFVFGLLKGAYERRDLNIKFPSDKYIADDWKVSSNLKDMYVKAGYKLCCSYFADMGMTSIVDLVQETRKHTPVEPTKSEKNKILILKQAIDLLSDVLMEGNFFTPGELDTKIFIYDRSSELEDKAYKNVNGEAILDGKKSLGFWLDRTYINESSFSDAFATSLHELTHKYGGDESAAFSYKLTDVMQKVFEAINSNPNLAIQLKILEKAWNEQN